MTQQCATLIDLAASLSYSEVHLLAAVIRVHSTPRRRQTVSEVLDDFDKLTGLLRRKVRVYICVCVRMYVYA